MKFQNLAYAGGQAGTFGVGFSRPPAYAREFAKNAILSCHLAIFVSLIPSLKGVGCRMASEKSKSHIRGRAGRNVRRRVFPPARLRTRVCKKLHFKLHPTPSFRHLIAQHPLTPIDPYRSSDRKRATVALLSFHCFA